MIDSLFQPGAGPDDIAYLHPHNFSVIRHFGRDRFLDTPSGGNPTVVDNGRARTVCPDRSVPLNHIRFGDSLVLPLVDGAF